MEELSCRPRVQAFDVHVDVINSLIFVHLIVHIFLTDLVIIFRFSALCHRGCELIYLPC